MASQWAEDEALIEACTSGDSRGWQDFVEKYERLIQSTVYGFRRQAHAKAYDTDDLLSLVYEKLLEDNCRRLRAWRGRAKLSTYLVQITRNLLIDKIVRGEKGPEQTSLDASSKEFGEDPVVGKDESKEIKLMLMHEAMDTLPERQVIILRLRLEGKSLRDIARVLGRPVGTVSVENSRALARIREYVDEKLQAAG